MAWAFAKLQDKKTKALSFFRYVRREHTLRAIKSCSDFMEHIQSTSRKQVRHVNKEIARAATIIIDQ